MSNWVVDWPLDVNLIRDGKMSNTFGLVRRRKNGAAKPHQGWDISARVGTKVFSISDGVVVETGNGITYGRYIIASIANSSFFVLYAHLSDVLVKLHDRLVIGENIALSGKTGNASDLPEDEEHLHLEIRVRRYVGTGLDGRISPLALFRVLPIKQPAYRSKTI